MAAELLRRHVRQLALHRSIAGRLQAHGGLGDAEVEHAPDSIDADHDVLRRHIAVHDIERLPRFVLGLVRGMQSVQHVRHDGVDDARRNRLVLQAKEARERLAVHVLHHQKKLAVGVHDIERLHDVGVLDARREPCLVEKHGDKIGISAQLAVQALDGDSPRKAARSHEPTQVHGRHAP